MHVVLDHQVRTPYTRPNDIHQAHGSQLPDAGSHRRSPISKDPPVNHASPEYVPIGDYAVVGDCASAALISRRGSVDWLCWPRFDGPSIFGALLDRKRGGCFRIGPAGTAEEAGPAHEAKEPCETDEAERAGEAKIERRYIPGTAVLETTFTTPRGVLRVTDLMHASPHEAYDETLWPDHQLVRTAECLEGEVEVELLCLPRPNYGASEARMDRRDGLGIFYQSGDHVYILRSEIPLRLTPDHGEVYGKEVLREGEKRHTVFSYDRREPAVIPPLGRHTSAVIDETVAYWQDWSGRCEYDGPYQEAVTRSLLTLKLMTYAVSGALVAAPTTSLPEKIGGERNWDYRYCWLRDATMTMHALNGLGYYDEEEAFLNWLLQATRTTLPELNVAYDVFGNPPQDERTLDHLEGYRQSRPVRIGNQAKDQLQLDIYGEVIGAAYEYVQRGRSLGRREARMLGRLGKTICERWREPDEGIWELRAGRKQNTYSKAMCWVGLDRLIKLEEEGYYDVPEDEFRRVADEIREAIETRGYDEALESYTMTLEVNGGQGGSNGSNGIDGQGDGAGRGGSSDGEGADEKNIDASLLLMALSGYTEVDDPRMEGTWRCIDERLGRNGLLYRYDIDDGLSSEEEREGTFGICGFWAVEFLARSGRTEEARERFEHLLQYANDVGLYSEEIDPESGAALGNFPQAFTHVGLISAALALDKFSP